MLIEKSDLVIDNVIAGQIILIKCKRITVKNHDLSDTSVGIELYSCSNCLVSDNILNNNRVGVYIIGGSNTVTRNHIESNIDAIFIAGSENIISFNNIIKNSNGIFWVGRTNNVQKNNFILNNRNAKFHMSYTGDLSIKWNQNYWGKPRILPKTIIGKKDIFLFESYWGNIYVLPIPWLAFDRNPAKKPYVI